MRRTDKYLLIPVCRNIALRLLFFEGDYHLYPLLGSLFSSPHILVGSVPPLYPVTSCHHVLSWRAFLIKFICTAVVMCFVHIWRTSCVEWTYGLTMSQRILAKVSSRRISGHFTASSRLPLSLSLVPPCKREDFGMCGSLISKRQMHILPKWTQLSATELDSRGKKYYVLVSWTAGILGSIKDLTSIVCTKHGGKSSQHLYHLKKCKQLLSKIPTWYEIQMWFLFE